MTSRRRFYAPASSFDTGGTSVTLSIEETRHLRDVLRLVADDRAFVFDGEGREFECVVSEVNRDSARLKLISEVVPSSPESKLDLTLALALLKGEKFDFAVQKITELGVRAIVPVVTKLADVRLRDRSDAERRINRWRRIAVEAAKQSGRAVVPRISAPLGVAELLQSRTTESELCLMFSERLGQTLAEAIGEIPAAKEVTALVGSEGGWTDEEIGRGRELGWKVVTLAGRTLRAETAAIAVTALIQHRLGDLS